MTEGHNRLPALASAIKQAHQDALNAQQTAFERARDAGSLLIEAKEALPHGQWLPWLKENVSMSVRTAQAYMKLAKLDEAKAQRVAHLSVRQALQEIATDRRELWAKKINKDIAQARGSVADLSEILGHDRSAITLERFVEALDA